MENIFPEAGASFGAEALAAGGGGSGGGGEIKIFLSLYKVQVQIYLLDFQKMEGNPFDFMTLCARIITELKALSQVSCKRLLDHLQPSADVEQCLHF